MAAPPTTVPPDEIRRLARRSGLSAAHCDALCRELPAAVDSLWRSRAWEIPEGHLEDLVKLGWLAWHGGQLALTRAGRAMHDAIVSRKAPS